VCGARHAGGPGTTAPGGESRTSILRKLEAATRGRFEFIRQLGRGGMGAVYLARELDLDRLVAIKVLSASWLTDDSMVERFRREAKTIASLRHPSIVHVHGVGRADELHYFIMDFIDGVSVGHLLRSHGPLSVRAVRAILHHVGSALSYAHRPSRGVIHRDIKPGNIMLDTEGNSFLTDFGISKVSEAQSGLTLTGLIMGTPEYMSPEQCRGDKVTYSSDQYALGAVVHAMLTGAPPFIGPHYRVLMAHTSETPPSLLEARPDCPRELVDAVARMLAKRPADRWPDIKDALSAAGARPLLADDPVRDEIAGLVKASQSGVRSPGNEPAQVAGEATSAGPRNPTWLRILEAPQNLEMGDEIELRATAGFADGSEAAGRAIRWESTDPSIVRVDPDTGRLVAVGAGSASVKAIAAGVAESIGVEVNPPRVAQLTIEPAGLELEAGEVVQLRAEPRGRRGQVLERPILWSSSDPRVASVSERGVLGSHHPGTASILAHCEGVGAAVGITVVAAVAAAVVIAGAPATLPVGERVRLRAEARDRRGQRLDRTIEWTSSNQAIAQVTDGTVVAIATGSVTVTAECEGQRSSCDLQIVPPPIVRVTIDDPVGSIAVEEQARVRATVFDSRSAAVERTVKWRSSDASVLTVDSDGWLQGRSVGVAMIVASCEGIEARTEIDVVPIPVAHVGVSGAPAGLVDGDTFHLEATPEDALGRPLDRALSWTAETGGAIESLGDGRFRGVRPGTGVVRVEADGVEAEVRLEIGARRVARLSITDAPSTLNVDEEQKLSAKLTDQRGSPIERPVRWITSDAFVARISNAGVLTGSGPGTATITAESDGIRDSVTVTVAVPPWATVVFKPDDPLAFQAIPPLPPIPPTAPASTAAVPPASTPRAAPGSPTPPGGTKQRVVAPAAAEPTPPRPNSTQEFPQPVFQPPRSLTRQRRSGFRPIVWLVPVAVLGGSVALWSALKGTGAGRSGSVDGVPPDLAPPVGAGAAAPAIARLVILDSRAGGPVADTTTLRVGDTLAVAAQPTTGDGAIIAAGLVEWQASDSTKVRLIQDPAAGGATNRRIVALAPGNVRIGAAAGGVVREFEITIVRPDLAVASAGSGNTAGGRSATTAQPPPARNTRTSGQRAGQTQTSGGRAADSAAQRAAQGQTGARTADSTAGGRAAQPPTPPQPDGTLRLVVNPFGRIMIDGAAQGGSEQSRLQVSLAPGTHRLYIENPNMMPFDTTFEIRSGVITTLPITLKPRS